MLIEPPDSAHRRYRLPAAMLLSCGVLVGVFYGMLQIDLPLIRYFRSLRVFWLDELGAAMGVLGSGVGLAGFSALLLVTGWLLAWPTGRRAGLESLIAHALVGLIVQAMKHVIGRPRPRFAHGDNGFYLGPSFDVGLDSFPSGHAAATFAVASVLAKHFPGSRSLFYAMAALIAVSRVTRGSHFPTDVTAGVIVGILTGFLVSHLTEAAWKLRFSDLLIELATYLTVVFGLLWTVMHQVSDQVVWTLMVWTGVAAMAVGVSVRLHEKLRAPSETDPPRVRLSAPNKLIAVGLALTTGSILVAILVMAAGVARWARDRTPEGGSVHLAAGADTASSSWARKLWGEMPVIIGLAVMALAIQTLRGLLPIM